MFRFAAFLLVGATALSLQQMLQGLVHSMHVVHRPPMQLKRRHGFTLRASSNGKNDDTPRCPTCRQLLGNMGGKKGYGKGKGTSQFFEHCYRCGGSGHSQIWFSGREGSPEGQITS